MRKLTKRITNNFGLKVLAAVFALVLWLVVVNVEDPDNTKVFTIPVTIENEEFLTDMGKTYEVLSNSDTISFTVTGKRSVIEELSESDFTAVANMENIDDSLSTVPITISSSRYKNQIEITKKNSFLSVYVENLITQSYKIEAVISGELAEDCYVTSTDINPEKVEVTGPESVMAQITGAQVQIDAADAEETIVTNADIILVDGNGNPVSQERLTLNRTSAEVDVNIQMEKTVDLEFAVSGTVADGYRFKSVTGDVTSVRVVGEADVLSSIRQIKIDSTLLDLTDKSDSFETEINLSKYLPDGISLADGEPDTVSVTVEIDGQETKSFDMPVSNISVQNLSGDLNLQFNSDTVSVSVSGFAEDLEEIKDSDLTAILDASGLSEGVSAVKLEIQGDYTVATPVYVSVTLSSVLDTDDSQTSETGNNAAD